MILIVRVKVEIFKVRPGGTRTSWTSKSEKKSQLESDKMRFMPLNISVSLQFFAILIKKKKLILGKHEL